jgi:hypothetical protein
MTKRRPKTTASQRPPTPLTFHRAKTVPDRRKQASKTACRRPVRMENR